MNLDLRCTSQKIIGKIIHDRLSLLCSNCYSIRTLPTPVLNLIETNNVLGPQLWVCENVFSQALGTAGLSSLELVT